MKPTQDPRRPVFFARFRESIASPSGQQLIQIHSQIDKVKMTLDREWLYIEGEGDIIVIKDGKEQRVTMTIERGVPREMIRDVTFGGGP